MEITKEDLQTLEKLSSLISGAKVEATLAQYVDHAAVLVNFVRLLERVKIHLALKEKAEQDKRPSGVTPSKTEARK